MDTPVRRALFSYQTDPSRGEASAFTSPRGGTEQMPYQTDRAEPFLRNAFRMQRLLLATEVGG